MPTLHDAAGGSTREGRWYRPPGVSAGRTAMWIIAGAIALAMVVVLATNGVSGWPHGWAGLAGASVLAVVAFALGYYE